jgi:flagellar hook protein FlgE
MFTGVSGLLNQAEAMNVIGNNISNVNTLGFKGSRMLFSDVLSTSVGSNSTGQLGHGVQIQKVDTIFSQSSLETTTSPTDVAIQGDNFFALAKPGTPGTSTVAVADAYFSRAGAFRVDNNQALINPDNYNVLDSKSMPIVFSQYNTTVAPGPLPVTGAAFDPTLGYAAGDIVSVSGINYIALAAVAAPTAPATLASPTVDGTNWLKGTFNSTATYTAGNVVTGANGSNYVNTTGTTGTDPLSDTTNWEMVLKFQKVSSINAQGAISLLYSDAAGNSASLYYNGNGIPPNAASPTVFLGTAKIPNPPGMEKVGGSLFRQTGAAIGGSGTPVMSSQNGSTEKIIGNNLELSNVDLANEFVKMILTQRAYSANSKTITTSDEMTQEILNLKR